MKRSACLFVALLLVVPAAAGPEDSEVRVEHYRASTVAYGSGTVIASGGGVARVLTAYHVCPDGGRGIVVRHKGKEYRADRLAWDQAVDLACLEVRAELPAAPVAEAPPGAGDPVYQWGHADGSDAAVPKTGRAVALSADVFVTTVDAREGDSGAGVFDARGRLVGVCTDRFTHYPGEAARPLSVVRRFLRLGEVAAAKAPCKKCDGRENGCDCVGGCGCEAKPAAPAKPAPETDAARLARLRARTMFRTHEEMRSGRPPSWTVGAFMDGGGDPSRLTGRDEGMTDDDVAFLARQRGAGRAAVAPPVVPYAPAARAADCPPGQP